MTDDIPNLSAGDWVKLILDKEQSPDNRWHGKEAVVESLTADAAGEVTDDIMDSLMIEVSIPDLPEDEQPDGIHFRWDDIEPLEQGDHDG